MSKNTTYYGSIGFTSVEAADIVKKELIENKWLKEVDGELLWVKGGYREIIPDDPNEEDVNKFGSKSLCLNNSSQRNIHRAIAHILDSAKETIDSKTTNFRSYSLDGCVYLTVWDEWDKKEFSIEDDEIDAILIGIDDDDHDAQYSVLQSWVWES